MGNTLTLFDHPDGMPSTYSPCVHRAKRGDILQDVRLRFNSHGHIAPDSFIDITISVAGDFHPFCTQVLSSQRNGTGFETQVGFLTRPDAFRIRMVEQLCQIRAYHRQLEKEDGQALPLERVAEEWIARFGADFPSVFL